LNDVTKGNRVE